MIFTLILIKIMIILDKIITSSLLTTKKPLKKLKRTKLTINLKNLQNKIVKVYQKSLHKK